MNVICTVIIKKMFQRIFGLAIISEIFPFNLFCSDRSSRNAYLHLFVYSLSEALNIHLWHQILHDDFRMTSE